MATAADNDSSHHDLDCPTRDALRGYLEGQLDLWQIEAIASHVERCLGCQQTLQQLEQEEPIAVADLKDSGDSDSSSGSESDATDLHRLHTKLRGLNPHKRVPIATGLQQRSAGTRAVQGVTIPPEVGQYEIGECLGHGAMGIVFKAWHKRLKRPMVLKILLPAHSTDPMRLRQFETEMEAIGKLGEHIHVVRASDAAEDQGLYFIAMDYTPGIDLSTLVSKVGSLRPPDACEIIRQAAMGLAHAHNKGMLHRDIKPSNLLLTETGIVKILDLGLAVFHQRLDVTSEREHYVVGTADYLAPERWRDSESVGPESDIYSLGCSLFKLLCGEVPYAQCGSSSKAKRKAHLSSRIPLASALKPAVSPDLDQIIQQMLAKRPSDRFSSASEVAAALEPHASGADTLRLIGNITRDSADTDRITLEQTLVTRIRNNLSRRVVLRRTLWAAGVLLVGALAAAVISWTLPAKPSLLLSLNNGKGFLWDYDKDTDYVDIHSDGLALFTFDQQLEGDSLLQTGGGYTLNDPSVGLFYGYHTYTEEDATVHEFYVVGLRHVEDRDKREIYHGKHVVRKKNGLTMWMPTIDATWETKYVREPVSFNLKAQFKDGSLKTVTVDDVPTDMEGLISEGTARKPGKIGIFCQHGGASIRMPRVSRD